MNDAQSAKVACEHKGHSKGPGLSCVLRSLCAEALGTFLLVFFGCGSIIADQISEGTLGHIGISIAFGLAVGLAVYVTAEVSGGHINPAISIGLWLARRCPLRKALAYVAVQMVAAIVAALALQALFFDIEASLTMPSGGVLPAFLVECFLSGLLMLVVLTIVHDKKISPLGIGAAVGGTICLCIFFGGPISGASMNPARSLGPAFVTGQVEQLWIYVCAPILGMAVVAFVYRCFSSKGQP